VDEHRKAQQEAGAMNDETDDGQRCPFHAGSAAPVPANAVPANPVAKELDPFGPAYLADPFAS